MLREKDHRDDEIIESAIYGNTKIYRTKCPLCDEVSFVLDGYTVCCETPIGRPGRIMPKRETQPQYKRQRPPRADQIEILAQQDDACFYCGRNFGEWAERIGNGKYRLEQLFATWDHWEPYCHSADNRTENFVAACQVCNAYKSNLIFDNHEDARQVLLRKWSKNGWRDVDTDSSQQAPDGAEDKP